MLSLTATSLFLLAPQGPAATQSATPEKLALHVGYVGRPESARGRSFVEFLRAEFATVTATPAARLSPDAAELKALAKAQVLVVDADLAGKLPAAYPQPMVVLSGPGVRTAESLGAKLDWL